MSVRNSVAFHNSRLMATKVQEKKATRREVQLERKVKELEEELRESKEILERHFSVQQVKRTKVSIKFSVI